MLVAAAGLAAGSTVAALAAGGSGPAPPGGGSAGAPRFAVSAPVLVARGAAPDATASNNEVKMLRTRAGLIAVYAGGGSVPQILLVMSRDGGFHWAPLAQASEGPVASRLAAIAADAAGRLHVVWTRYDDGVGKVYYRAWAAPAGAKDAAAGWTSPQRRISPEGGYAGYPAVALDRAGHPHVVWYGIRQGQTPAPTKHGSIYEILYTGSDGRAWSRPVVISSGPPDAINPALVSDASGRLHAVWYQYNGRVYQVRYAHYDNGWAAPEGVSRASADEFNPDIAADGQGRLALAWEQHDAGGSSIEYARRLLAGGARPAAGWGDALTVSSPTAAAGPAYHPSVATDATGAVWIAWDADDGQIYARRYKAAWGPVLRLTSDGGNAFPSTFSDGGALDVVWTHTSAVGVSVYFARVTGRP